VSGAPRRSRAQRLLRWYPDAWRVRYGDEFVALIEDTYGDDPVPARCRLGIARAGMAEHLVELGFGAGDPAPAERLQGGALLVLAAWGLFVVGGSIFAKVAEHWDVATPKADRWLPSAAYLTVVGAAALGAVLIGLAVAAVQPSFVRFLRDGGWSAVRRPVVRAAVVTAVAVLFGAGIVVWAHHIGPVQRNGGSWLYGGAALVGGLLLVATVAGWTVAAGGTVRRLGLSFPVLRFEGLLAVALAVVMVAVLGATTVWWAAVATDAPGFLSGAPAGAAGSPVTPPLLIAGACMLAGMGLAVRGAGRVTGALRSHP
jgi:hypothetical protein